MAVKHSGKLPQVEFSREGITESLRWFLIAVAGGTDYD
jgi:hypothetical protein